VSDRLSKLQRSFESIGEKEPIAFSDLKQMNNVILTPHIAGWTHESNRKMADVLVGKIKALKLL
jgi:D-3-phosphoglycerate dehydrogenase